MEEIPAAVIGRRLRPQDPGRPIDARVLAVKIAFGEATPLKLGQKVEVEFQAAGHGSTAGKEVQRRPHGSPAVSRRARPPGAGVIEAFSVRFEGEGTLPTGESRCRPRERRGRPNLSS